MQLVVKIELDDWMVDVIERHWREHYGHTRSLQQDLLAAWCRNQIYDAIDGTEARQYEADHDAFVSDAESYNQHLDDIRARAKR